MKTEVGTHDSLQKEFPDGTYVSFVNKQRSAEAASGPAETVNPTETAFQAVMEKDDKEEEKKKLEKLQEKDKEDAEALKQLEEHAADGMAGFLRLMEYNRPVGLVIMACFGSLLTGGGQPLFGWIFSKVMVVLIEPVTDDNIQKIKDDTSFYALMTFLIGVAAMIGVIINKTGFGILGQNVTLEIRILLYKSILRKNIGWFDERDNATSVLTSAMAEDTSVLNGVSTESLGPMVDACCAVLGGIAIGFVFTWKMSLVCLGITPVMIVASGLSLMLEAG